MVDQNKEDQTRTEGGVDSGVFSVSRKLSAEMNEVVGRLVTLSETVGVEASLLASCILEHRNVSRSVTGTPGKRDVSYSTNL